MGPDLPVVRYCLPSVANDRLKAEQLIIMNCARGPPLASREALPFLGSIATIPPIEQSKASAGNEFRQSRHRLIANSKRCRSQLHGERSHLQICANERAGAVLQYAVWRFPRTESGVFVIGYMARSFVCRCSARHLDPISWLYACRTLAQLTQRSVFLRIARLYPAPMRRPPAFSSGRV